MNAVALKNGGYGGLATKTADSPAKAKGLASYFSQINIGTRSMGDKLARKIEKGLNLPPFFMDLPSNPADIEAFETDKPLLTYDQLSQWHKTGEIPTDAKTYHGKTLINLEPGQAFLRVKQTSSYFPGSLISVELSSTPKDGDFIFVDHEGDIEFCRYKKYFSVECFRVKGRDVERTPGDQIIAIMCAWSNSG